MPTAEEAARRHIDRLLSDAGWIVQDRDKVNYQAGRGVAIREFSLASGFGFADYLLYVDGQAVGVIEAKPEGTTLTGVELQAEKYSVGVPAFVPAPVRPLPFLYQSTGIETRFTNRLDPDPRSRQVFQFHRPETLAALVSTTQLRTRLQSMPPVHETGLWPAQLKAVHNLEHSLTEDRPRALIQMATGSGKTFTAITSTYRLIKFGGARRVLFLVDRANLGRQALKEFQDYTTPDDGRKFTELYNVQFLTSDRIDLVARVCICTIQRLYSMLQGETELDADAEEGSLFDTGAVASREPLPVTYNPTIPIETFDIIFIDECHRSIYNLWRQVLEYFDAHLIGLTATPSKQTFGFFNQNLVMEYNHEHAVADGVNVDFTVYRIRTEITERGSTVEAKYFVGKRDRKTRAQKWEELDDDLTYGASALDRDVVATDQIRTVIQTYRDKLFTEIFPGRSEVPKTLIYAKDDSHADDIVQIVREEFGKGNQFCEKITYRTGTARIPVTKMGPDGTEYEDFIYKSTSVKAEDLLASFRNSYYPRIVVTVDMIATGTDIRPLEVVMFLRSVKSLNYFEQMKGRGVRVINDDDFQAVTPDAKTKTHFVIVDCVGVCEQEMVDSQPLERNLSITFAKLLQAVAVGATDPDMLTSLAGRLARLDKQIGKDDRQLLAEVADGLTLREIAAGIIDALDPDRQVETARAAHGLPEDAEPSETEVAKAAATLLREAVSPLTTDPALRARILEVKERFEQTIDEVSADTVLEAGYSEAAREKAVEMTRSFEAFIAEHKDEITALQVLYSRPYARRLLFSDIKALAETIKAPPRSWTPEVLWRAYETVDQSKVRSSGSRILTDIVSLVRYALHQENELISFRDQVEQRFEAWISQQEATGRKFTNEQRRWLELIRDHIAGSVAITPDDFDDVPFAQHGGLGKVYRLFGDEMDGLLNELNEVLVA